MALRLLTKGAAVAAARPAMIASRQAVRASAIRGFTTQTEEPKQKANSLLDALPGNSIVSKTGYVTGATGLAAFLISKEIYILNEETLVLIASTGLLGVLLKYLREPFTNMANEHINRIKNILVQAREDHKSAVQERIDEVGQMKDLVDVTKALFELSRETAQLEAEAFELKQKVAVASEVKTTLDSWVRHEANIREREQKQLAAYLIEKVNKELQDPKVQQEILDQAIVDIQNVAKSA
ncbi:uncharacterized protein B0P05DRAFT_578968 [Gilbertella persicaria]|uniref:ATP synthase subunit 4 n=1 Tax=Rhizopus stolonifer TaxID=4846 RepID=A0A367KMN0_RHIST|nr:uncharacterized protein B0P05DRAFT_578968 [Gilbertella persicaria]KAI8080719.1 hypothetical protein B0P05DRAFT_578968 [Gilbertella persicaria]RCI03102.1 atp4 subunit B of the stator stalk of mitochondrial F1F0 ATP synthase [Rhizopus stolonifer]